MPCGLGPPTVTTVTPVAKAPKARRSCWLSVISISGSMACSRDLGLTDRNRGQVGSQRRGQRFRDPGGHGAAARPAHARDPLPAAGDERLAALVETDVVEAEFELCLRKLDQ